MSEFTYIIPFSMENFMKGIIYELKDRDKYDIANLIKGASVEVSKGEYSYYNGGGRWDAISAYINFYVNPKNKKLLDTDNTKDILESVCKDLIPANVGYDVKGVSFKIDLTKGFEIEDDLIIDLEKNTNSIASNILREILAEDVKIKGYHMAEVYTYLYSVENSLRLFIEKICKEFYGEDYFNKINVTRSLQNTISNRKENAKSKKWLSIRGNELFYLDFKDLGTLIDNNWELFKKYFPNRDFIIPKLNEMADCRNLIAHNSYIGDTERNLIKTYYNVILKQISETSNEN